VKAKVFVYLVTYVVLKVMWSLIFLNFFYEKEFSYKEGFQIMLVGL